MSTGPVFIDDQLDAETLRAAAAGVVEQLARTFANNPARTVRSLQRVEVENIAQGAISGWIRERARQVQAGTAPTGYAAFLYSECGVPPLSPAARSERADAPPLRA